MTLGVLLVCAHVAPAGTAHADAGTPQRTLFSTRALLRAAPPTDAEQGARLLPSQRLDLSASSSSSSSDPNGPTKSRYALPMVLSAVVPGAGEISLGHWWRGVPLVALDVATWLGYAHFNSEGNSIRDDYESFADAHWSEARWQTNLPTAYGGLYYDETAPWNCDCSPPYIPPDEDQREYYENLGKYRQFFPGWEDWSDNYDPENPESLRRIYADMRIDSNNNFDNAHRMLGVAALTRLVSVAQSFWLVRSQTQSAGLMLQPVTFGGLGSGLKLKATF